MDKPDRNYSPDEIDWMDRARCREEDPGLFVASHQNETKGARNTREALAKLVCAQCEVKTDCLEYALKHNEKGVWGMMNGDERSALKRDRRRQLRRLAG